MSDQINPYFEPAQLAWAAYSEQANGVTFDGKPLPSWDDLGEDRQDCWLAAARAVVIFAGEAAAKSE